MGRMCIVPYCGSGMGDNVSFHELPADLIQRNLWLKNISRGKSENPMEPWVPLSDRDCVCSKHFKPTDYRRDTKRRVLLKNTLPTVFDGYPAYKKIVCKKQRPPPKQRRVEIVPKKLERRLTETYIPFPITSWDTSEGIRESPSFSDTKISNNNLSCTTTTFTESDWTSEDKNTIPFPILDIKEEPFPIVDIKEEPFSISDIKEERG